MIRYYIASILLSVLIVLSVNAQAEDGKLGATSTAVLHISVTIGPKVEPVVIPTLTPTADNIQQECMQADGATMIVNGVEYLQGQCVTLGSGVHDVLIKVK